MPDFIVPAAISSQLDNSGEERIHVANVTSVSRPAYVPPVEVLQLLFAMDNVLTLGRSVDGGATFPDTVTTGLPSTTSEVCVMSAGGRLFHFGLNDEARVSTDGDTFSACTGVLTTSGFTPGAGNMLYINNEWQLYHWGLHVSSDGESFTERTVASGAVQRPVADGTTVLAYRSGAFLQVSTDSGTTFSSYNPGTFNSSEGVQRLLAVPGTRFLAFGRDSGGSLNIGISATGLSGSWTIGAGPATAICHGVARDSSTGRIVMVLQTGAVYYSTNNGDTWNAGSAVPYAGASTYPPLQANNMIYSNGYFYFTASQGSGINRIYRSPDGVTAWAQVYTNSGSNAINSMCEYTV